MFVEIDTSTNSIQKYFRANDENALEIDFGAMDFKSPTMSLPSSIGNGVNFASKFITSKLYAQTSSQQMLVDYLLALNYQGEVWNVTNKHHFSKRKVFLTRIYN